jgi:prepilin-type processing-associated H-X9-DG protein
MPIDPTRVRRKSPSTAYLPSVVSHAGCCGGDDLRHEAVSEAPVLFADGHACVDCCPCLDCGAYRAALWELDPSAWPPGTQPDMRESARPGESEKAPERQRPRPSPRATAVDFPAVGQLAAPGQPAGARRQAARRSRHGTTPGRVAR